MGATTTAAPSALLARLFDDRVAAAEIRGSADPLALHPQELAGTAHYAPKRLAEFTAGRLCARYALARFDITDYPIVARADRSPGWPPSIVGSITHTEGFCGSVAASADIFAGIGIDVESLGRVNIDIAPLVFGPQESALLAACDDTLRDRIATIIFSAKEAFYKCQFDRTKQWLDFHDAIVTVRAPISVDGEFILAPSETMPNLGEAFVFPIVGRYAVDGKLVATGIAIERPPAGRQ